MSKKLLAIYGVFLALVIILLSYFFLKKRDNIEMDALKAVPVDAALILETNDFQGFIQKMSQENKIWQELIDFDMISGIDQQMLFLDSVFQNVKISKEIIQRTPLYVSAHQIGKDKVGLIWILNLPKGIHEKQVQELISDLNSETDISHKEYNRIKITQMLSGKGVGEKELSVAVSNGVLLISSSVILVERAIRQMELEEGIIHSYGFRKVAETAGKNVDGNLYINFNTFPGLLSILLNVQYRALIEESAVFAEWAELDVNIKDNSILLNGFSYGSDSTNSFLNLFFNQSSPSLQAEEVLPANTIAFLGIGISDYSEFQVRYEKFLAETGKITAYQNDLKQLHELFEQDVREPFYSILEDEMGIALTDIKNFDRAQNSLIFFKTKSKSEAEEVLLNLIRSYVQKRGLNFSSFVTQYRIDAETRFPIYRFPVSSLPEKLFGRLFGNADFNYFIFVDNYLFFGNSIQALSRLVHNNVLRKTLRSDLLYREFSDNLSSRSNFHLYVSVPKLLSVLIPYSKPSILSGIEKHSPSFQKIQALGTQFSADNTMAYNNVYIRFQPVLKEEALTVWESLLDTSISFKPQFIENHYTHDNEIFIQDKRNNIYLINSAGRILWKVQIPEKIMGEVYQIDYYKNNKLQLLFNTRNQIHLIDRNGNYVERYPVNLRAKATNPISVFDYDKSRDYRFFIAGEDQKVYAYLKDGNIVRGWSFNRTESKVTSEIQHFRIGNKDYIVFADERKIYILDRRGNTRVRLNQVIPKSKKNSISLDYLPGTNNPRMVVTDTAGVVHFISFSGNVETLQIKDYSSAHFFDLEDLDGNGSNDLVFMDQGRLEVFKQNKSRMFSYDFDDVIDQKPVSYTFSTTNKKIGVVSRSENRIYLINNDGELYKGFPLTGNTLFSIGRFKSSGSRFNLIVGNEDNFLYNYSVQ